MKKNLKLIVFAIVLCAVSALNVKIMLDTEYSSDLLMTSLAAIGEGNWDGEGGGDFPTDPFPGSGQKAYKKVTSNYYEYSYSYLFSEGMDSYFQEYRTPVTEIDCPGVGEVICYRSVIYGASEKQGIVCNPY